MKKFFSTIAALLIVAAFTGAKAQYNDVAYNAPVFKQDIFLAFSNAGSAIKEAGVTVKAIKNFNKNYKNVTDAKWYMVSDGFIAGYNENGIDTKVAYDQKGNWDCMLRTYGEGQLPADVRQIVKSNYYDATILVVYEITHSDNLTYILKIEDATTLKTLRITNGEMEVIADYKRG